MNERIQRLGRNIYTQNNYNAVWQKEKRNLWRDTEKTSNCAVMGKMLPGGRSRQRQKVVTWLFFLFLF